eukprot:8948623-Pyramimonas_sp.AAC.1
MGRRNPVARPVAQPAPSDPMSAIHGANYGAYYGTQKVPGHHGTQWVQPMAQFMAQVTAFQAPQVTMPISVQAT